MKRLFIIGLYNEREAASVCEGLNQRDPMHHFEYVPQEDGTYDVYKIRKP